MTHKIDFYVNLEKCPVAAEMVAKYGQFLEQMPLEGRQVFRAVLAAYHTRLAAEGKLYPQENWLDASNPINSKLVAGFIHDCIDGICPDAWESEQLVDWIYRFIKGNPYRIESMIRALCDSISQDIG